jgi:hypothetical protein
MDADFINDGKLALVEMYVEEINENPQEMNDKTVQIHKKTQGSAIGLRIQLIDVTTGDLFKEMRLNIDAIGCHIGGNLLVFVAEHKRLLSVRSIDNSLNLTHAKEVPIGDYDRQACK